MASGLLQGNILLSKVEPFFPLKYVYLIHWVASMKCPYSQHPSRLASIARVGFTHVMGNVGT